MKYLLTILILSLSTVYGQQARILIIQKTDTFFIWHQYATETYLTSPPIYGKYVNLMCDTLFLKDSLIIKQIQDRQKRRLDVVNEFYRGINFIETDSIPQTSIDTGQTTIGIITSKKGQDTVKVLCVITKNRGIKIDSTTYINDSLIYWRNGKKITLMESLRQSVSKPYKAILYSVRQLYKWSEHNTPDAEPQYFFKHIKYLGQDKKELPKSITVIKSTELK